MAAPAGVTWRTDADTLTASTSAYSLAMDSRTGAPRTLSFSGRPGVTFGNAGWWRLTREDGQLLSAADCAATVTRTGDTLRCEYTAPQARVMLTVVCGARSIDLRATVRPTEGVVTRFALPASVVSPTAGLNRVYFPFELGRSLERPFFTRQPEDRPGHWTRIHYDGGEAAAGLIPTQMRDYNEPAVPVTVTDAGRQWLGTMADALSGWTVRTPRPPSVRPAVVLLDTPSGPLLSLETVGDSGGGFLRWGGVFSDQDLARVRAVTAQVADALRKRPATAGRTALPAAIGIVDLGLDGQPADWEKALSSVGGPIRHLRSPAELLASLKARDCGLIVNPDGELIPATATGAPAMLAAIRDYVAHGGVWVLTGGAPFYNVLQAQPYLSVESDYPPAFSDFLHLDLTAGQVSVYGVQDPKSTFVPAHLAANGTDAGATLSREWITWAAPGQDWQTPTVRLAFGSPVQEAIRAYGAANGFTRSLATKVKPNVLARLKQSVLLKYNGGTYRDQAEVVRLLPKPVLIHVSNYLHGGFDKQYPDHLPPNPSLGTPDEFRQFIRAVQGAGDLFMPYTNPTWWCDHPRGPTFEREGEAPLLKDRQGKPVREAYGPNDGWSLTTFHPAALAAEQTILRQFTTDYRADVLFQDQIGARGPQYDFNPASPTPYAYTQGLMDIARRDSKAVPLATENGFDGILNAETQFCGLVWGLVPTEGASDWVRLWRNAYPAGAWRFAPLALWLGHDKALFTMHDLGQFVTNRETLAWVMALGYQISATSEVNGLRRPENRQWLLWLAAVQKAVGPHIMGAPLTDWREVAPGVYRARYGRATVTANTTARPFPLDATTTLSAYGFSVTAPGGLTAGWFSRYMGHDYGDAGLALVRQGAHMDVYAPGGTVLALPGVGRVTASAGALSRAANGPFRLPAPEGQVAIPTSLRGVAPKDRVHPPQAIGVLSLPWMTYGWASTTAEQWVQGLTAAMTASQTPLAVRPLTSYEDMAKALAHPDEYLALINPYGEHFPAAGPGRWQETLRAVRDYCAHGGSWFETSAYPFYQAQYLGADGTAGSDTLAAGGLALFGYGVEDRGNAPPPDPLSVTLVGRQWLGEALSDRLTNARALVNRPFAGEGATLDLVRGAGAGFVSGVQPGGWGWLWRFGGSDPPAELSVPIVATICRHLFLTPPTDALLPSKPSFYKLQLQGGQGSGTTPPNKYAR